MKPFWHGFFGTMALLILAGYLRNLSAPWNGPGALAEARSISSRCEDLAEECRKLAESLPTRPDRLRFASAPYEGSAVYLGAEDELGMPTALGRWEERGDDWLLIVDVPMACLEAP